MNAAAFVSGAGSGIGKAIAYRLAVGGYSVCGDDRDAEAVGAVARDIEKNGARALGLQGDVTDPDCVDAAIQAAEEELRPLEGLVPAAGVVLLAPIDTVDLET